jgi:predicted alpha/beta-hydrolase family hydrolase
VSEGPLVVDLPAGQIEVSTAWERPVDAWATIAVAHGAGAGYQHPFLEGLSRALVAAGVATLRFNFPYVEAGRRMPGPASHAIATWRAVFAWLTDAAAPGPVWAAGKSYGGRMASMAAADGSISPAGLIYLGYPLHPPGDPAKARVAHLPDVAPPQLFVSGTNDPFVDPRAQLEAAVASCRDATLRWVDGGGHSFEVKGRKRPADEIGAGITPVVVEFLRAHLPKTGGSPQSGRSVEETA